MASQESKEDQEYLLKTPYQDGIGQKCPAFAIAARNGHVHVVDSLISKVQIIFCRSLTVTDEQNLNLQLFDDQEKLMTDPF